MHVQSISQTFSTERSAYISSVLRKIFSVNMQLTLVDTHFFTIFNYQEHLDLDLLAK